MLIYRTDRAISDAIRAIDTLIPKILNTKGNNDTFIFKNNGSLLESKVINFSNFSVPNMTFPERNATGERVIVPTDLFANSTDSPIRVSICINIIPTIISPTNNKHLVRFPNNTIYLNFVQVTTTIIPGDRKRFSGIISVVLTRLVSGNNLTNSSTSVYTYAPPTPTPTSYSYTGNETNVTNTMIEVITELEQDVSIFSLFKLLFSDINLLFILL